MSSMTLSDILASDRPTEMSRVESLAQAGRAQAYSACLALEVRSAGSPASKSLLLDLADSYAELGCSKTSRQLLKRLVQFKDTRGEVFTRILSRAVEAGDLKLISGLYSSCKSLSNPDVPLIKALARASEKLGQTHLAAQHWSNLVHHQNLADDDWRDLARFISRNQNCQDLNEALLSLGKKRKTFRNHTPLIQFCLIHPLLSLDRKRARNFLGHVQVEDLLDPDTTFDFAILGFRLRNPSFSFRATEHFRSLSGPCKDIDRLERVVRLFDGENQEDLVTKTVRIDASIHESLLKEVSSTDPKRFLQGRIHAASAKSHQLVHCLDQSGRPVRAVAPPMPVVGGFSIHPECVDVPDPWEILSEADLSVPHIMLLRSPRDAGPYTFVSTGCRSDRFAWDPARLEVSDLTQTNQKPVVIYGARDSRDRENPLWMRILEQISQYDTEDETSAYNE